MKKFLDLTNYPFELIKIVTNAERKSAIANFLSTLIYLGAAFNSVPTVYLFVWITIYLLYFVVRTYYFELIRRSLSKNSDKEPKKTYIYLTIVCILIFFSSILWGIAIWLVVISSPILVIFFTLLLIIGLAGGAISTLSSIPHIYVAFTFPMMFMQFLAMLYANEWIYWCVAMLTIVYYSIVYKSSRSLYSYMLATIKQRKEIELAKIEAEKANKAKSAFLANISHELRSPINAIIGFSRLAYMNKDKQKQKEQLKKIHASSEFLLELVNDLLDSNKLQENKLKIKKQVFDLTKMVHQIIESISYNTEQKRIKLIQHIDNDIPKELIGDQIRITQIINNLLSNAFKFTDKGEISISIRIKDSNPNRVIIDFDVCDTGIGIDNKHLPYIFDNFYQIDTSNSRSYEGTGLGLAISKKLAIQMGGEIKVTSQVNKGSCFKFTIPLQLHIKHIDKIMLHNETSLQFIPPISKLHLLSNMRILVVDDCLINQELMQEILQGWNINVTIACNGQQAIKMFQKNTFGVVLMDIQMPIMDGYEATLLIRKMVNKTHIIIIAMTAHAMQGDKAKMLGKGMDDYISKPFKLEDLFNTLLKWNHTTNTQRNKKPAAIVGKNATLKKTSEEQTLNIAIGLANSTNNKELYYKLLNIFKTRLQEQGPKVGKELQQSYEIIHNFKGLSATLGAVSLSIITQEIQQLFDDKKVLDDPLIVDKLEIFNDCVKNVIEKIESLNILDLQPQDFD